MLIFCHAEEFLIRWHADFKMQELLIFTPSLFVPALTDFLIALPAEDVSFSELGVSNPLQFDTHFMIKICLEYQDKEKWYLTRVSVCYGCHDISFEPLPSKGGAQ